MHESAKFKKIAMVMLVAFQVLSLIFRFAFTTRIAALQWLSFQFPYILLSVYHAVS